MLFGKTHTVSMLSANSMIITTYAAIRFHLDFEISLSELLQSSVRQFADLLYRVGKVRSVLALTV